MLTYLFYIFLGFLPSLIWLAFYLRKDSHPEPNSQVLKIFIWGMLIAPLAVLLQFGLVWLVKPFFDQKIIFSLFSQLGNNWRGFLTLIVFAPVVEEYLKYAIVKEKILKNPDFDEPLDAMLYLIIGALGFAAVENLVVILKTPLLPISQALGMINFRFIGATFLHALASGIVGYFLAKSLLETKKRFPLIIHGLGLAIILHSIYNYLINLLNQNYSLIIVLAIVGLLSSAAIFVSISFKKLKKQLSICKIR